MEVKWRERTCAAPHWEREGAPLSPEALVVLGKMVFSHPSATLQDKSRWRAVAKWLSSRAGEGAWPRGSLPGPALGGWGQRPSGRQGRGASTLAEAAASYLRAGSAP